MWLLYLLIEEVTDGVKVVRIRTYTAIRVKIHLFYFYTDNYMYLISYLEQVPPPLVKY